MRELPTGINLFRCRVQRSRHKRGKRSRKTDS